MLRRRPQKQTPDPAESSFMIGDGPVRTWGSVALQRCPDHRGGGCGIRTREGVNPTRFPSERHRPLGESSRQEEVTGRPRAGANRHSVGWAISPVPVIEPTHPGVEPLLALIPTRLPNGEPTLTMLVVTLPGATAAHQQGDEEHPPQLPMAGEADDDRQRPHHRGGRAPTPVCRRLPGCGLRFRSGLVRNPLRCGFAPYDRKVRPRRRQVDEERLQLFGVPGGQCSLDALVEFGRVESAGGHVFAQAFGRLVAFAVADPNGARCRR